MHAYNGPSPLFNDTERKKIAHAAKVKKDKEFLDTLYCVNKSDSAALRPYASSPTLLLTELTAIAETGSDQRAVRLLQKLTDSKWESIHDPKARESALHEILCAFSPKSRGAKKSTTSPTHTVPTATATAAATVALPWTTDTAPDDWESTLE